MRTISQGVRLFSTRALLPVLLIAAVLLCGSFGIAAADGVWLPENYSTIGEKFDHMWQVIFVIVTVIFFLTEGLLLLFIIRYRKKDGRKAFYFPDNNKLETVWTVIPGLILLWLALYQWNAWADAKIRTPDESKAVLVEIQARQFEWNVRYAGPDGVFATDDDVTLTNQLYIPEKREVIIQFRAVDVIHSFFLPNHRVKQDIVPGMTTLVWFDALEAGTYEIACAELCGLGHYRMRGQMYVKTQGEFDAWLQEKYDAGTVPSDWGWGWKEGI